MVSSVTLPKVSVEFGALGAGLAALISRLIGFLLNSLFTWQTLQAKINLPGRLSL